MKRPSSPSTSGIDHALVLRNSAAPHADPVPGVVPRHRRAARGANRSTLAWATRDSGFIASVISEKKNFSRSWPRKLRAVEPSTRPPTRSGCRCHSLLGDRAAHRVAGHQRLLDAERVHDAPRRRRRSRRSGTAVGPDAAAVPALVEGDHAVGARSSASCRTSRGTPCSPARAAARSSGRRASGRARRRRRSGLGREVDRPALGRSTIGGSFGGRPRRRHHPGPDGPRRLAHGRRAKRPALRAHATPRLAGRGSPASLVG